MKLFSPAYSDDSASRVFLACVPVLFFSGTPGEALHLSVWIAGIFLALVLFFTLTVFWFAAELRQTAFFLGLAVAVQCLFRIEGLHPALIASLFLLMPTRPFSSGQRTQVLRQSFVRALFFVLVFSLIGALREVLGERLLLWSFRLPAGAFLLLFAGAFLWRNQPALSSSARFVKKVRHES